MSENFVGGWLSEQEDREAIRAQSAHIPVLMMGDENIPEEMNILEWMQIEHQGSQGSCAGHARTSCLELCVFHQTRGTLVQLCRQFAYITAQMLDGINGDRGSTIMGNIKASEKWGCPEEKYWPYSGQYDRNIPQLAWEHAKDFRLHNHSECHDYDDVFNFLKLGLGGVQIGIDWTLNDSAEPLETYTNFGSRGGHSVSFLDWSPKKDSKGRRYLRMFNSWGKNWADRGTRLISPTAINQMFNSPNTVMVGLSDMADLKPRSVSWIGEGSVFG